MALETGFAQIGIAYPTSSGSLNYVFLDSINGKTQSGNPIILYNLDAPVSGNQLYRFTSRFGGTVIQFEEDWTKCLGYNTAANNSIILTDCTGSANLINDWTIKPLGNGYNWIQSSASNSCLRTSINSKHPWYGVGNTVDLYPCDAADVKPEYISWCFGGQCAQNPPPAPPVTRPKLTTPLQVSPGEPTDFIQISATQKGLSLNALGNYFNAGTFVGTYAFGSALNELFRFTNEFGGVSIQIEGDLTKCIDYVDLAEGKFTILNDCNLAITDWVAVDVGNGHVNLMSSGLCLTNSGTTYGSVQLAACVPNLNLQQWCFGADCTSTLPGLVLAPINMAVPTVPLTSAPASVGDMQSPPKLGSGDQNGVNNTNANLSFNTVSVNSYSGAVSTINNGQSENNAGNAQIIAGATVGVVVVGLAAIALLVVFRRRDTSLLNGRSSNATSERVLESQFVAFQMQRNSEGLACIQYTDPPVSSTNLNSTS